MERVYNDNDLARICGMVSGALLRKDDERMRVSALTTLVQAYPMHVIKGVLDALHETCEATNGGDIPESAIDGFRVKSVSNMNTYTGKDGFEKDAR